MHGYLTAVGTAIETMNKLEIDWLSAPFHCCTDYKVNAYNIIAFETAVYL